MNWPRYEHAAMDNDIKDGDIVARFEDILQCASNVFSGKVTPESDGPMLIIEDDELAVLNPVHLKSDGCYVACSIGVKHFHYRDLERIGEKFAEVWDSVVRDVTQLDRDIDMPVWRRSLQRRKDPHDAMKSKPEIVDSLIPLMELCHND
jgi:hypothetical protein